ncbi:MAG: TetR-like C-terminal domain-containing protein [Candidatus Limivivens sp.]|nr:TetR-like C-terminal domain-containing protein [Candidatus Limivivens sp.]
MSKTEQTVDRRVRKTKKLLLDGLTQLMQTKDVSDISVKELSDLVDINRGTFYLHYRDIFDMLSKVEDELFDRFNEIVIRDFNPEPGSSPLPFLQDICYYLRDNENVVRALIGPHGDLAFVNRLKDLVRNRIEQIWNTKEFHSEHLEYYFSFIISGCLGLIETWFGTGLKQTPDEVAKLATDLLTSTIQIFS